LAFYSLWCNAQSLDQAKKLYNEGLYEAAKPVFERLVSQSPNNSSYSLWYGVCCLETNDFTKAEKYLLLAKTRKVTDASRYLATMYTTLWRFGEAIEMWEDYIDQLTKKKEETAIYEKTLERIVKLNRMKSRTLDVQIIDSTVLNKDQILSAYFLSEDCGFLQWNSEFFQSSDNAESTVYINPKGDVAYYARSLFNGHFSLFTQSKLLDTWSDDKAIFASDTADNNYPFVLGDGLTIYFASKGYGSIGGYDLFITRYNTNSNGYLSPEQLGMPFNSPANDYLMVIDEVKGVGWFVSDRFQPEGKVCVYLFIPDDSRMQIPETGASDQINARAALISIRDTWKQGSNYEELISLAKTNIASTRKQEKRDFDFFVNDRTVYYALDEFRSAEAKSLYEQALNLKQRMKTLEVELNEKRLSYTQGNQSIKDQLKPTILYAENEMRTLHSQTSESEKKARNAENLQLNNNR
jgi:tetratricopeptide (TPR) repeat protein